MKLPEEQRLELAQQLYQSVGDSADADVERGWAAEIEQRVRKVDSGQGKMVPWEKARELGHTA